MKRLLFSLILLLPGLAAMACPACQSQQPKMLKGISHGTGPQGPMDMVYIWATIIIIAVSFFYAMKWIIKPGEKNPDHIKRIILTNND